MFTAVDPDMEELRYLQGDASDDLESWRSRCLRAEAEVRAVKRLSKVAERQQLLVSEFGFPTGEGTPTETRFSLPPSSAATPSNWRTEAMSHQASHGVASAVSAISFTGTPRSYTVASARESQQCEDEIARLRHELTAMRESRQVLETSHEELQSAYQQQGRLVRESHFGASVDPNGGSATLKAGAEVEELRQQLKQKSEAIMQLQVDMVKDKHQIEQQRKYEKEKNVLCSEELVEMTQRAKSLSEQVRLSSKKSKELQAMQNKFKECQSKLASEASERRLLQLSLDEERESAQEERKSLQEAVGSANKELWSARERSLRRGDEHMVLESRIASSSHEASEAMEQRAAVVSKLEEVNAAAVDSSSAADTAIATLGRGQEELASAWQARHQKIVQGVAQIGQVVTDLQKELRATKVNRPVERFSPRSRRASETNVSSDGGAASEKLMGRLAKQLERLQQLVDQSVPKTVERSATTVDQSVTKSVGRPASPVEQSMPKSVGRSASPEGERPAPEDKVPHEKMALQKEPIKMSTGADSNILMQQKVNEYRLEAARTREDMMAEHCAELDDLVSGFNAERRQLHNEIRELKAELNKADVAGAAVRPMSEIRAHFESQVAIMKRELVSQLTDVHEREKEQREDDERELEQMQQSLQKCQQELLASQEEFGILSALYDKERQDNLHLKAAQRVLELRIEAEKSREADKDTGPHRDASSASSLAHHTPPHHALPRANIPTPTSSPPPAVVPPAAMANASATANHFCANNDATPVSTGTWDSQVFASSLTPPHTIQPVTTPPHTIHPPPTPPAGTPTEGSAVTPSSKTGNKFATAPSLAATLGQRAYPTDSCDSGAQFRPVSHTAPLPVLRSQLPSPAQSPGVPPPPISATSAGQMLLRGQTVTTYPTTFPSL